MPVDGIDTAPNRMTLMQSTIDSVHNGWWRMHRTHSSKAKLVHGDIYQLPGDLGTFDIGVFGSILLHLREPWGALSEAAGRVRETIVVTDLVQDRGAPLSSNIMRISPLTRDEISNWWTIYPGAVVKMLERLGFPDATTTEHKQKHHLGHRLEDEAVEMEMEMFTVVGRRAG